MLEPTAPWTCPVSSSNWATECCLLYRRQFQDKWIISCLESSRIKTSGWQDWLKEARINQLSELQAVSLAVMGELSNGKSPQVWVFTDAWAAASGPAMWLGRWAMETGLLKGQLVDVSMPWQEPPSRFGRWLEPPSGPFGALPWGGPWVHETRGHGGAAVIQRWGKPRYIPLVPWEAQNANKNGSVNKRDRDCRWLPGKFPRRRPCTELTGEDIGPMPVALGTINGS